MDVMYSEVLEVLLWEVTGRRAGIVEADEVPPLVVVYCDRYITESTLNGYVYSLIVVDPPDWSVRRQILRDLSPSVFDWHVTTVGDALELISRPARSILPMSCCHAWNNVLQRRFGKVRKGHGKRVAACTVSLPSRAL